ncbi:hypothetical protein CFP56_037171 [Quercus suber]|uniref:Eukaryotic translation initiation factor 3 30 kDa subunit n=1 Tax=Quercus suber TaxID=58331 RepID=A0AAW0LPC2_QUESU
MEDSEDDQIPAIPTKEQPKNKWDDEDVDDDDVKESWEDEDEPTPAPETKPPVEKAPKKPTVKATEKKGKTVGVAQEEPLDPVAEKLRKQRKGRGRDLDVVELDVFPDLLDGMGARGLGGAVEEFAELRRELNHLLTADVGTSFGSSERDRSAV